MFFAEPARAFANLRTALRPSGRLAFACWRKFNENPWLQVPLRAALEHVPPLPRPGPEDPGPFSFASEQRVHRILADAGFRSVIFEPRDFDLDIACGGGIEEPRILPRGPRDVCDGWSTDTRIVAVDTAIAYSGPRDVAGWSMVASR